MGDNEEQENFRSLLMKGNSQILKLDSLEIGYVSGRKKRALLSPLTATASKGEMISIIGMNGIGKSTLLRTLAGVQKQLGGSVFYGEREIREFAPTELARIAGYISTEPVKTGNMTVYDLVSLGRYPYTNWIGTTSEEDKQMIYKAMEKTAVMSFSQRYLTEMSDGERQKAMIARLVAQDTDIMLMDEPTSFLDVRNRFDVLHLLYRLTREESKTIIFTTHDLDMAIRHSDKIWLILGSGLVEGAPEDLIMNGHFDNLFGRSSSVHFNPENGSYTFKNESRGAVHVEGSEAYRHWTEEALKRAGYDISAGRVFPLIKISENKKWTIITSGSKIEYASIYDMIAGLSGAGYL
jgi:iron complex transport system ATP-binding protein